MNSSIALAILLALVALAFAWLALAEVHTLRATPGVPGDTAVEREPIGFAARRG